MFSQSFFDLSQRQFGISPTQADQTFHHPDQTSRVQVDGLELILLTKSFHPPGKHSRVILLMVKPGPQVDLALLAFPDLAQDIGTMAPLQLLELIVRTFGLPMTVGGETDCFFLHRRFPLALGAAPDPRSHIAVPAKPPPLLQFFSRVVPGNPPQLACALCFALDLPRYKKWLKRHK